MKRLMRATRSRGNQAASPVLACLCLELCHRSTSRRLVLSTCKCILVQIDPAAYVLVRESPDRRTESNQPRLARTASRRKVLGCITSYVSSKTTCISPGKYTALYLFAKKVSKHRYASTSFTDVLYSTSFTRTYQFT